MKDEKEEEETDEKFSWRKVGRVEMPREVFREKGSRKKGEGKMRRWWHIR